MQPHDLIDHFILRLERSQFQYMITGSVLPQSSTGKLRLNK